MSDHNPEVKVTDIRGMDIDISKYITGMDFAFRDQFVVGYIGDNRHQNHVHYHMPGTDPVASAIRYAQDDLWDAQWLPSDEGRHGAVKHARDVLRALRKQEVRERYR